MIVEYLCIQSFHWPAYTNLGSFKQMEKTNSLYKTYLYVLITVQ